MPVITSCYKAPALRRCLFARVAVQICAQSGGLWLVLQAIRCIVITQCCAVEGKKPWAYINCWVSIILNQHRGSICIPSFFSCIDIFQIHVSVPGSSHFWDVIEGNAGACSSVNADVSEGKSVTLLALASSLAVNGVFFSECAQRWQAASKIRLAEVFSYCRALEVTAISPDSVRLISL